MNMTKEVKEHKPEEAKSDASSQAVQEKKKEDDPTFKFNKEKLNQIVSQINISYIPDTKQLISIKTYQEIVDKSVDLAEEEFIRLTFQNREDRRKVLAQDKKKYIQIMMDHMNEIENLLMKAQEEICLKLGINQKQLEDSEMILIERGLAQHILMMQAAVRQRIKDRLPKKKDVSEEVTRDIIKYQIKLLNDKQELFIPILKELPISYETQQLIPIFLNLIINDQIYEEYTLEEEDFMQNLSTE